MRALLVSVLILSVAPGGLRAGEAADAFECADCHPMKIRDFKSRRGNPIIPVDQYPDTPTGVQDIASTSRMCFSCHDGFVMDSRDIWGKDKPHGHRVGMAPGDRVVLPELGGDPAFPMNDDGKMYCGSCHSPHLSEAEDAPSRVRPFMRADTNGQLCLSCHEDKSSIAGSGHDKGRRRQPDYGQRGTCGSCHAAHGSELPLMWARSQGEGHLSVNRFCRSCHEDEAEPGEHPPEIVAWSQDVRDSMRSNTPAEMPVFDANSRHASVGAIGCPSCHDPHRERADGRPEHLPGLHLRTSELVEPVCADCHGPDALFLYKFFHSPASR